MHPLLSLLFVINLLIGPPAITGKQVGKGKHPSVATDPAGKVHVVYGQGGLIYYTCTQDGNQFAEPVRVDSLPGLHLGASRGPQIAATKQSVVITAIDKAGNIWSYTRVNSTGKWQKRVRVNDVADIAKEGFVALTAGPDNSYMATWLDLRGDNQNKIVGARSVDGGKTWLPNQVLYQSPDGTVCECCQLSIVSQRQQVAIMFRNFINGARDMYLVRSSDGGKTVGKAEKLGEGTWQLKACPMDGGGLFMTEDGKLSTVWRRNDKLFIAKSGQPETEYATGKNAKIVTTSRGDYIVFQQDGQIWGTSPGQTKPALISTGGYPKLALMPKNKVLCLWEEEGTVQAGFVP
ncbi:sialidase family protein [Spirosoma foliorum]|uniref:Exo-alpha-sialidase n=1 Tax=Spirosoma foliorum TaxID=2710596 RepID=A0A7G5H760_9BACT|nr:sialidase family protein [Spirosoma foliorum]QMW06952.1 exo-alpha-sialidase [Spirosoma foliorum]